MKRQVIILLFIGIAIFLIIGCADSIGNIPEAKSPNVLDIVNIPKIAWGKRIFGTKEDRILAMVQTVDGLVTVGSTWAIKFDLEGILSGNGDMEKPLQVLMVYLHFRKLTMGI